MTDKTRNDRAKRLYDRRLEQGQVKLTSWVSADAKAKLERLAAEAGLSREQYLERLINRA